jgi:hypothetical protein
MSRRERELQNILLEMADGLRSKARVALNDHVSGNVTDLPAILRAAADELQLAAGATLEKKTVAVVPVIYGVTSLSLTRDGKISIWSAEQTAALVRIDISQDQVSVLDPRSGRPIHQRPTGLHMSIHIDADPSAVYNEVTEDAKAHLH